MMGPRGKFFSSYNSTILVQLRTPICCENVLKRSECNTRKVSTRAIFSLSLTERVAHDLPLLSRATGECVQPARMMQLRVHVTDDIQNGIYY